MNILKSIVFALAYISSISCFAFDLFVELPDGLKGRSTLHIKFKNDNPYEEQSSGFYALTEAIDVQQTYGLRRDENPYYAVKRAFERQGINNAHKVDNLKQVAHSLSLDNIFLNFQSGILEINYGENEKLQQMRKEIVNAGSTTSIIKHVFFKIDRHVVMFSIIRNEGEISITIHDNLNQPIRANSPLYKCANYVVKFFLENER